VVGMPDLHDEPLGRVRRLGTAAVALASERHQVLGFLDASRNQVELIFTRPWFTKVVNRPVQRLMASTLTNQRTA
jgi:hypothetical protein